MKKVLIAHQSTIPHYRVPFYNSLKRLKPDWWSFDVVFDRSEIDCRRVFEEPVEIKDFEFSILGVKTLALKVNDKTVRYQTFWAKAAAYDLVIVENAVNNLAYILSQLHQIHGVKFAYWGHERDRSVSRLTLPKWVCEKLKLSLMRRAHGFFAYTEGVKAYLAQSGVPVDKIITLNNTIDIVRQRELFTKYSPQKESIKEQFGLAGKKVLLFVGRFTNNKRIGFLLEAFSRLHERDNSFHLLMVGSGENGHFPKSKNVKYFGSIVDPEKLAQIYVISDLFTFPGAVGLGPLQALCYDLPVVTIESATHMPEFDYLLPENSIILPVESTPDDYARRVAEIFNAREGLTRLKEGIWPSIEHLTIDKMAMSFISGVNMLLGEQNGAGGH